MDVHVYIGVTDLEHGIAFYTQGLGLRLRRRLRPNWSSLRGRPSLSSCWCQTDHRTSQDPGQYISTSLPTTSTPPFGKPRMPARCWIALYKSGSGGEWPI